MTATTQAGNKNGACDHRGIFSIPGSLSIQSAWRDITYQPIRGKVWTASEGIYRTIFVRGRSGVIAFDTFSTPGGARAYAAAIARVLPGREIHTIVYSHDHLDHTGYASDLSTKADILAHELCAKVVLSRKADGQLPPSEVWCGERKEFHIDDVRFELIYPGPTHGDGNVAAYFPEHRILFMVDTVIAGVGYTFYPDWHFRPYEGAMRRLLHLDWDIFVPGHFWILDRHGFVENLNYWEAMMDTAQCAIADGVPVDNLAIVTQYAHERLFTRFGELFRFEEYVGMNLMRFMLHYLTGGWGIDGNIEASHKSL